MARRPFSLTYPVQLDPEEDGRGVTISFPDLFVEHRGIHYAGGYSHAASREDELNVAADLLATVLCNLYAEGVPIPPPSPSKGRPIVSLDPLTAAKLELWRALYEADITQAELARRLGIAPQQVARLFNLDHASRIDQIEAALRALGRRLVVTSEAA